MIASQPGEAMPAALHACTHRMSGGVLTTARPRWLEAWPTKDGPVAFLADHREETETVRGALMRRDSQDTSSQRVVKLLHRLATSAAADRRGVFALLHDPCSALVILVDSGTDSLRLHRTWVSWCWAVEAVWDAVDRSPCWSEVDRAVLRPLAARLRFLVLSEPFRHRAENDGAWLPAKGTGDLARDEPFRRVFGEGTWHELVHRAREARWTWQACLDSFETSAVLAQASCEELEEELDALVFTGEPRPTELVCLAGTRLANRAAPGSDDLDVARAVAETHLLPRFRLSRVFRIARWSTATTALPPIRGTRWLGIVAAPQAGAEPPSRRRWHLTAGLWTLRVTIPAAAFCGLAWTLHDQGEQTGVRLAAWLAVAVYAAVLVGTVLGGRLVAYPLLLRWPAASVLGLLVLAGFAPDWWTSQEHPPGWPAVATVAGLLTLTALGYLAHEVSNHGVHGPVRALRRTLGVLSVGAAHAALVTLIGVVLVLPSYVEDGDQLQLQLTTDGLATTGAVLTLATAWCLLAGVLSQILWDDRPITAPLAHTSWRTGRKV